MPAVLVIAPLTPLGTLYARSSSGLISAKTFETLSPPVSKPTQVIYFDYLFLSESDKDEKYVLVIKDDLSGYCWLDLTPSPTSEHTAEVLARWTRVFTAPEVWVSDQGSQFKNKVIEHLTAMHQIHHNMIVAYSPWVNGTVESIMRSVLSATRAMRAELKLALHDWASVTLAIASAINEAPLDRLDRRDDGIARSPLQAMTGIEPKRAILLLLPQAAGSNGAKTVEHSRARQVLKIKDFQAALSAMHKDVESLVTFHCDRAIT